VLYGGDAFIDASFDRQRDKLCCSEGRDRYAADKLDFVSSSCEVKVIMAKAYKEHNSAPLKARQHTVIGRNLSNVHPNFQNHPPSKRLDD
jgi:hypothetical protein